MEKTFTCQECGTEKAQQNFWPYDVVTKDKKGGLSCRTCQPLPPCERGTRGRKRVNSFTCFSCQTEKPRSEFWSGDISRISRKKGISCTTCEPKAPNERKRTTFTCKKCKNEKPRSEFHPRSLKKYVLRGAFCKDCKASAPQKSTQDS